ncbi:hypothetical protein Y032_0049g1862 [Ancylostoma ceylanicum]|uniref:Uncharacterized protein n=1 Tax=Ancylostoma ceylanicum TaxID=53326 RepID=A0A016UAR4_9BILA|nr:hypothetical protein Y032_0049g1862 [Ancylostoma ceylanicum]
MSGTFCNDDVRFYDQNLYYRESSELRQLDSSQPQEHQVNWEVFEAQKKQIQEALNAQTYHQFSAYAQQQFPGQPEQLVLPVYPHGSL